MPAPHVGHGKGCRPAGAASAPASQAPYWHRSNQPPPLGAWLEPGGVRFRAWAPGILRVEVDLLDAPGKSGGTNLVLLTRLEDGVWDGMATTTRAGASYRYRLDGDSFPDPYSRSQPEGVHGPSEVVDSSNYAWHDHHWPGLSIKGLVPYECHVGTATPGGTFDDLATDLPRLVALGVNAIEIMPVAEFPGTRNWGYDGVYLFAPSRNYGGPDGLRRLVDAAHQHGLGVILDVVYNHLGPEGNYLGAFSRSYFTDRYQTPWGDAMNYDGPECAWVRRLAIDNALFWVHEYHLDGLRLDATFAIHDGSTPHLLQELTTAVRASLPPGRSVVLIAETSENDERYLRPAAEGGFGFDACWADDFHHSLRRYLCGDDHSYFGDYAGTLEEVAETIHRGWLFEGQHAPSLGKGRGTPARTRPAWEFLFCLQNHDQVGNRAMGDRLHACLDLNRYRVATALWLLLPYTPLLFMGQEFAASSPFQYFTDHSPDLGRLVTEGRRKEFEYPHPLAPSPGRGMFFSPGGLFQPPGPPGSVGELPVGASGIPDPQAEETFLRSKLRSEEARTPPGEHIQRLYQVLLALRRSDPVFQIQDRDGVGARAVNDDLLAVTWSAPAGQRLLLANFGQAATVPASLFQDGSFATPWHIVLETSEMRFGGPGAGTRLHEHVAAVPATTAVLLARHNRPDA